MPLYYTDPFKVLFLDIETVSEKADFEALEPRWQELWEGKTRLRRGEESPAEFYQKRAAVMAEFGKVICISCGFLTRAGEVPGEREKRAFRVKSFYGEDEKKLLSEFAGLLTEHLSSDFLLCAHNGREFDFPFLARRMIVNGIRLPALLNTSGLKPWEVRHLDTMEMWKFGDYKHYSSVSLLASLFGIPTPKDDIDGSMVGEVYWKEKDLKRIVKYCQKDTITVARIFLRMENLPPLLDDEITIA